MTPVETGIKIHGHAFAGLRASNFSALSGFLDGGSFVFAEPGPGQACLSVFGGGGIGIDNVEKNTHLVLQ
jgi:hypothetical protein